jgi:GT2 family glycosyltransferase
MPADVDIIILSYKYYEHLEKCVDSVLRSTHKNIRIYIVDNNSEGEVVSRIKEKYSGLPQITLIENGRNLGFAEGNNVAMRRATAKYIVVLNNDTIVKPGWLEPMLAVMEAGEKIGACQPKLLNLEDSKKFDYSGAAGGYIDRYGYPFLRGRLLDIVENDEGQYDSDVSLDWCSGAAFMVRKNVLDEVGLLDPMLFMYGEENDLCWRIRKCGYKIVFAHESVVYHAGMGSTRKRPLYRLHLNYRNGMILLLKNFSGKELLTRLPVRIVLDFVNVFYFIIFKTFQLPYVSIIWAYGELLFLLPGIAASRTKTQSLYRAKGVKNVKYQTYDISIIWQYFAGGKRRFSELDTKASK